MNPTILADLRNVLADLYPDEPSICRLVDDAGIARQKIAFGSSAGNIWHSVLIEAEKVDRVEALLQIVKSEYGNNREFQAACQAYRQSQGKQETVNPHVNVSAHQPKIYPKTWRQRLPAVLLGILLVGLAGSGAYWRLGGLQSGGIITPTATAAMSTSATFTKVSPTSTELPTATQSAVSPTVANATTASTSTATISPPASTPPEIAKIYPCEAETSFLSNIRLIGLRSAPTGRVDRFVPGGVTVLVMGKHQGENLYDIWYSEENIRGWISPENLILPDSCPK